MRRLNADELRMLGLSRNALEETARGALFVRKRLDQGPGQHPIVRAYVVLSRLSLWWTWWGASVLSRIIDRVYQLEGGR